MSNFQPPQRKKNALDNSALRLVGDGKGGKAPSLSLIITKNKVKITVYTNDPNDQKDYGKITATISVPFFQAVLDMVEEAANATAEYRKFLEVKDFGYPNGKRSEAPMVLARIIVGRDPEGLVWISVTANGRPNIQFPFIPQTYNTIRNGDSSEITPAETSQRYARSWSKVMGRLVAHLAVIEFEEYVPKQQNGGGGGGRGNGGGGWNNGGGNGGGGGQSNSGGGNSGGGGGGGVEDFGGW